MMKRTAGDLSSVCEKYFPYSGKPGRCLGDLNSPATVRRTVPSAVRFPFKTLTAVNGRPVVRVARCRSPAGVFKLFQD
jgi:hypothetical protein